MPTSIDALTVNTHPNGVSRLIQTVEGVGGRADIHIVEGPEGWDVDIRCKILQIQIHEVHMPTVLITLLRMDNWMRVDIYASSVWTMVLAQIVADGGGCEVEELRFCIGDVGVRFHTPSAGQSRPQYNVDVVLETEEIEGYFSDSDE
ncbi:hypothetical protein FPV67DRAFT_1449536 [Lyophyllum atratum]|nr:hypothetical protein FPV67DRAFT_1449536 [Lyophyllum atratum]